MRDRGRSEIVGKSTVCGGDRLIASKSSKIEVSAAMTTGGKRGSMSRFLDMGPIEVDEILCHGHGSGLRRSQRQICKKTRRQRGRA